MDDADDKDPGLAGLSPEFQAMVGGMAGHAASFAKLLERRTQKMSKEAAEKKDDAVYLESYADLAIHEDMLKDQPRCEAYSQAIDFHGPQWSQSGDVTVIDVGSGTGLLAVLSARAGARRVVAVEASRLAHFTKQIVEANTSAGTVEVHECRAEDIKLGDSKVADVIISEWMGYFLLFENMLPSVLSVRDRYLKPGGIMLPSRCRLQMAPLQNNAWRDSKIEFWRNVHNIDMSALVPLATAGCEKPQHQLVPNDCILGDAIEILGFDSLTVQESDLKHFEATFTFDLASGRRLDGFASWFDCEFGAAGWLLSTAPTQAPTHWRQTAFYFRQPLEGGGGITVTGKVVVEMHEAYSRGYRVTFEFGAPGRKRRMETFELR